ncbi:phosphoglucosamine mutase [Paenibacillus sp. GSMTC-2017]|nr:phosphoglucosamine mutase [Paenibacillus sp. GSMTC-2017]
MKRLFGTDGIRELADPFFTDQELQKICLSIATYLNERNASKVVIGLDTRESGNRIVAKVAGCFRSLGYHVIQLGVIPTPAVAFLTKHYEADMGIMISASHNSFEYNGIKLFDRDGYKISDEAQQEIELIYRQGSDPNRQEEVTGGIIDDKAEEGQSYYVKYLKLSEEYNFNGLKIIMDCANGAAYKLAPKLFNELGAEVIAINAEPNGKNINHGGSLDVSKLQSEVLKHGAAVGVAFDGDADRLIAVDEMGQEIDGNQLLYLFAVRYVVENKECSSIVSTEMCNLGLVKSLKKLGVKVIQTSVGDRNVMFEILKTNSVLGGEPSGHIMFKNYSCTSDGMLAALKLVSTSQISCVPMSELKNEMIIYPQVINNIPYLGEWQFSSELTLLKEKIKSKLGDDGKIIIRKSGSEPVIRVMIESADIDLISEYMQQIQELIHCEKQYSVTINENR